MLNIRNYEKNHLFSLKKIGAPEKSRTPNLQIEVHITNYGNNLLQNSKK